MRYLLSCDYPHLPAPPPPPPPSLSLLLLPQSTTVMACQWGPHHANANATHDAHPPPCCPSIPVILVTTLFLPLFLELFDCCAVLSTSVIVVAASAPIEVRGILCVRFVDKFKWCDKQHATDRHHVPTYLKQVKPENTGQRAISPQGCDQPICLQSVGLLTETDGPYRMLNYPTSAACNTFPLFKYW